MMLKKNKTLILTMIICMLPMLLGIVLYNQLPEQMAIHFSLNDTPDNYASKPLVLFGIPILMTILQGISMYNTNKKFTDVKPKIAYIMEWFIPILTVILYIITIAFSLNVKVYIGKTVCFVLGIMFIVQGNYLPKMNYEDSKGVFHPTMKDEKSFRKKIRLMGYGMIGLGIIMLVGTIFA